MGRPLLISSQRLFLKGNVTFPDLFFCIFLVLFQLKHTTPHFILASCRTLKLHPPSYCIFQAPLLRWWIVFCSTGSSVLGSAGRRRGGESGGQQRQRKRHTARTLHGRHTIRYCTNTARYFHGTAQTLHERYSCYVHNTARAAHNKYCRGSKRGNLHAIPQHCTNTAQEVHNTLHNGCYCTNTAR